MSSQRQLIINDDNLTPKQCEAMTILAGPARHILLRGGARCVAGDTILDGHTKTIKELAEEGRPVPVLTSWGWQMAEAPFAKGTCPLFEVKTESGRTIRVTPDHRFWNGHQWVFAETLSSGSEVAVRTCSRTPPPSNWELCPSEFLSGVQRLTRTREDFLGHCSCYLHQCGQQPHRAEACDPTCRASQSDGLGHSRVSQTSRSPSSEGRGSSNHKGHRPRPSEEGTLSGHKSSRHSNSDGSPRSGQPWRSSGPVSARTSARFRGRLSTLLQYQWPFGLLRSSFGLGYSDAPQSGLGSSRNSLASDTPFCEGYELEKVLSVTRSAEEVYYTLHVPVTEQYFANGFLNHNSGKTWLLMRAICIRALKAPGSTHLVLRYRFNHLKTSIIHGTMPDVLAKCFPGLEVRLDKTDWFHEFPNGSRIWYGGLDDKGRTEKILGQEHSTILFEEISHGISWDARNLAVTRLSQSSGLKLKTYATCNPPSQAHWSYKLWKLAQNPKTGEPLPDPENYASLHMNPTDNLANLPEEYVQELSNTSGKDRIRFFEGEWQPAVENALWTIDSFKTMTPPSPGDDFDTFRTTLSRIVVAVDPSGGSGKDGEKSDETGIIVAGRMHSGRIVILEDATVRAGPAGWARKVVEMYDKWEADRIVAEKNYGGAMVEHTIKAIRRGLPVKMVNATRGKHVRAGPVAALYDTEPGVYHLGHMPELEDQLMNFTDEGYEGDNSPDRADAAVWSITELGLGSKAAFSGRKSGVQAVRGLF